MRIAFDVFVYTFCGISLLMIFHYLYNLSLTLTFLNNRKRSNYSGRMEGKVNMIVILPCLREQNVIEGSIEYFSNLKPFNVNVYLLVACTNRELETNEKHGFKKTTAEIAKGFIKGYEFDESFVPLVYEADDPEGDRATQMNYAVDTFLREHQDLNIDIVAAFDADSRPIKETFDEVAFKYRNNPNCSYQQPDMYLKSADDMKKDGSSYLAMANAIYQNEWTMLSEIPMLIKYGKSNGKYKGYFYCNGHGEFFPLPIWKKIRFPEHEITDGIHIGYRLGMSGYEVEILDSYGNTDAPHSVKALPKQHKRWFGGCNRLLSCYKWCKANGYKPKKTMVIAGLWSQARWAFTAPLFIVNLLISILSFAMFGDFVPLTILCSLFFVYCYVYSLVSLKIDPVKRKFPIVAYLLVPFAIFVKSIGPTIYNLEKIFRRKQVYEKVER